MTEEQIREAAEYIAYKCEKMNRAVSVEEIQDMVENQIMASGAFEVAKGYVRYRYNRSLVRKANTTDDRILSILKILTFPSQEYSLLYYSSAENLRVNTIQKLEGLFS